MLFVFIMVSFIHHKLYDFIFLRNFVGLLFRVVNTFAGHVYCIINLLTYFEHSRRQACHISKTHANIWWKSIKNCGRNRPRTDEMDTETEICTYLNLDILFAVTLTTNTESTLIYFNCVRIFVTICGKNAAITIE